MRGYWEQFYEKNTSLISRVSRRLYHIYPGREKKRAAEFEERLRALLEEFGV